MSFTGVFQSTGTDDAIDGITEPINVEGELYDIGTNRWAGFDQYLIGMKPDETREFDFIFENVVPKYAGKTAHFTVTVHMGMKHVPHPLNDEFLKKIGVSSIEDLTGKLKMIAKTSAARSEQESLRNQVGNKLIEANPFDIPKFLIDAEVRNIVLQKGHPVESFSSDEIAEFIEQAERSLRLTLILDSIRDTEPDSVLNDAEARNNLISHLKSSGKDPAKFFGDIANANQIHMIIHSIKEEFTLQWVAKQATQV